MNEVRISKRENIRNYQIEVPELKNTITELKIHNNSRRDDAEEQVSDLEDRAVELSQTE